MDDLPYWKAYVNLSTERIDGGAIPWSRIELYYEKNPHLGEQFVSIIRALDSEYIDFREDELERRMQKNP